LWKRHLTAGWGLPIRQGYSSRTELGDLVENEGIKGVIAERGEFAEGTAGQRLAYATFPRLLNPMSNNLI
jgi:hypothetical protein